MNVDIRILQRKLNNEWIAFVDENTLKSVLELRDLFCPEVIKEVEYILSLATTPKERKNLFYKDCINTINDVPQNNSEKQRPNLSLV